MGCGALRGEEIDEDWSTGREGVVRGDPEVRRV